LLFVLVDYEAQVTFTDILRILITASRGAKKIYGWLRLAFLLRRLKLSTAGYGLHILQRLTAAARGSIVYESCNILHRLNWSLKLQQPINTARFTLNIMYTATTCTILSINIGVLMIVFN
jgi:hypothetical protein